MRLSYSLRFCIISFFCILLFPGMAGAQNFTIKNYSAEYGIPDEFIYTLNQSDDGYLLVSTGKGLARFDGYEYDRIQYPDSVNTRLITTSLKDKNGTMWFGCNDGTVLYLSNEKLIKLKLDNIRSISQIIQGPDSLIYVVPQGKSVFRIDPDKLSEIRQFFVSGDPVMSSASFTDNGMLLIGTQGKVLLCNFEEDSVKVRDFADAFDYSGVTAISKAPGKDFYLVGTEYYGLFRMELQENGILVERFPGHPEWESLNVSSIFTDPDHMIWVSTFGSGVIRFSLSDKGETESETFFNKNSGLLSNDAKLVFRDLEGNYWFGLFSAGLHMLGSNAIKFSVPGKNPEANNILFSSEVNGKYFLGTSSGYHIFDLTQGKSVAFTDLSSKLGGVHVLSYHIDDEGKIWVGTDGKGIYVLGRDGSLTSFFRSGDSGLDKVNDIDTDAENIWLGTINGLVVVDRNTGRLKKYLERNDGLAHNFIYKVLVSGGKAYLGVESERFNIIDKSFNISEGSCLMEGSTKNIITSMSKSSDGAIWIATKGNGVFECNGDSVRSFNRVNGLFSNYCYGIFADSRNNIWVGHENGISRIDRRAEIIRTYNTDYSGWGICNSDAFSESADGRILIGTGKGLVVYDGKQEKMKIVPPFNNINSIIIDDVRYPFSPEIRLPYGTHRITINYSGVNFSDPEKVWYATYLENYDNEYSEMKPDRKVSYNLRDGHYIFHLQSIDENGNSREPAISFKIIIAKPLYKKWWFILFAILVIGGIVIFIIRERDKAQIKIRKYLEDELEKRTSQIMQQKAEIELQNFEIKDSINYAKRIQSNLLPDVNRLKDHFSDAFILFRPRDIVSGDFYWFSKVDSNRFIVVCADSTGHGVPGAFMSMIGSTLLQDIVTRKMVTTPSQILAHLDKEIFATLNQNIDNGIANDGMDMVVCDINTSTRHVRFASAMRPIIIVISGESNYIKGNRSSVGGESVIDKCFIDQEYYLSEGDTIYLFSDGLPDQFGGTDGKKMKIARLKRVIEQISALPMEKQEKAVLDFYNEWKGSFEQVDDILFMGIRV
ncbi:MAG TPA: SpoIIE family protein phosphatase [Bacteroidales bacterium]|nr:SpoIIE family protein phosphatase [Bacteroidales bacterium]